MARQRQMKLGGIFVFFLIVVALIPFLYSYFGGKGKFYSAFTDITGSEISGENQVVIPATLPSTAVMGASPLGFGICRNPGNGTPCPEGSFCDGSTNQCQQRYVS
jgi:hypothetical protein